MNNRTTLFRQRHPDCQIHSLEGVYMWAIDRDLHIVDISPRALKASGCALDEITSETIAEQDPISTVSVEARVQRLQRVFETGMPDTLLLWDKLPGQGWAKIMMTTTRMDDDYTLTVAHDLTDTDLGASWLKALRIKRKVMVLGRQYDDAEISFGEMRVLRGLLFNKPYKVLAHELGISESTITYRANKLKTAFQVNTIPRLLTEISANGLIYLFSIDDGHPILSEVELFIHDDPEPID